MPSSRDPALVFAGVAPSWRTQIVCAPPGIIAHSQVERYYTKYVSSFFPGEASEADAPRRWSASNRRVFRAGDARQRV